MYASCSESAEEKTTDEKHIKTTGEKHIVSLYFPRDIHLIFPTFIKLIFKIVNGTALMTSKERLFQLFTTRLLEKC